MSDMKTVIVVGAGSAGCVVAARLTERDDLRVILFESGPKPSSVDPAGRLASVNWIDALGVDGAFDQNLMATRLQQDAPRLYHRGRCIGGSGAVNAMLALPGLPQDYDSWAGLEIEGWSWADVEPTFAKLKSDLVRSASNEFTPVDAALVESAAEFGLPSDVDTYLPPDGGGALWRNADSEHRVSSWETYLMPVLDRPNLEIRTDVHVDRLIIDGNSAVGVILDNGERIEADEMVLCAGAIETPAILLRSNVKREGIGKGLQDHPAASFYLRLRESVPGPDPSAPCIGAVLRLPSSQGPGDLHILPVHGTLGLSSPTHEGVLMAAVMAVTSTGSVTLDPTDPTGPPVIAENMLSTERDRLLMVEAIAALKRVLSTPAFESTVADVFIDRQGTPVSALNEAGAFEDWLNHSVGDYFHAVGTARMGSAEDPMAVVDASGRVHGLAHLTVIDASIIPLVPRANTHLPVVMVAERLAPRLIATIDARNERFSDE